MTEAAGLGRALGAAGFTHSMTRAKENVMRKSAGISLVIALLLGAIGSAANAQQAKTLSATDYAEIQRLYYMYAWTFDSSDPGAYGAVFTPDGEFQVGEKTLRGPKEIGAMAAGRGAVRPRPKIFHVTTNIIIQPSSEGARGSAYVVTMDLQKNPAITGGGIYEDVIVKTMDGWRFKKRTLFPEATATAAAQSSTK